MLGSAQMIRFIQRDEVTHLILFQNMIKSTRRERPELFTKELIDEWSMVIDLEGQVEP